MKNVENGSISIIGQTRAVGNSSGVLLPREWLNKKVVVTLAEPTEKEILRDVIEILYHEKVLRAVLGIYLVGSYARREQSEKSDIDILVVTKDISKEQIEKGIYSIIIVSEDLLEEQLKKNIFPLGPMVKEAKALLNASLLEKYKNFKLTRRNLNFHIETTKSILNVHNSSIALDKDMEIKYANGVSYSLVLRLRGIYIVDCLIKKKLWKKKEFLELLKKVAGSAAAYEGYLRVKANKEREGGIKFEEAERLIDYISKKIKEQEKWAKERR
ncbi:MAG: DUF2080 family transposase-associated protein [Candidatus Pacearchaeota archaeon]